MKYSEFIRNDFTKESNKERIKYIKGFSENLAECNRNWGSTFYDLIPSLNIESLLDVGCGDGSFCYDMVTKFNVKKAYGIDIASVALDLVKKHENIIYFDAEAKKIPLEDNSVDFITSFDVLEHVLPNDVDLVIEEFNRVSKIGLLLTIAHDVSGEEVDGSNMHMTVMPLEWWKEKLEKHFTVFVYKVQSGGAANSQLVCRKK